MTPLQNAALCSNIKVELRKLAVRYANLYDTDENYIYNIINFTTQDELKD